MCQAYKNVYEEFFGRGGGVGLILKNSLPWILKRMTSNVKNELHIYEFTENSQEYWMRIGKQVMCGSSYSYILGIQHYAPNQSILEYKAMHAKLGNCACMVRPNTCNLMEKLWIFAFILQFLEK